MKRAELSDFNYFFRPGNVPTETASSQLTNGCKACKRVSQYCAIGDSTKMISQDTQK